MYNSIKPLLNHQIYILSPLVHNYLNKSLTITQCSNETERERQRGGEACALKLTAKLTPSLCNSRN